MLKVEGDCNVSYKIECHKDEISIEVEYKENLDDIGENEKNSKFIGRMQEWHSSEKFCKN